MRERLYRSRHDRMLFGVAGGMAEWMDLDPAIVRLVWALLILAAGVGLLLYIVAAIVIPEAPIGAPVGAPVQPAGVAPASSTTDPGRPMHRSTGNSGLIFGLILVVLGGWFLLRRYLPEIDLGWLMPAALIVIGLVLVAGAMGRGRDGA